MKRPKEVILDALQQHKGDELDKEYGQSGRTRRQILNGYKRRRNEIENAILWINTL
jgi:hypothetical protein